MSKLVSRWPRACCDTPGSTARTFPLIPHGWPPCSPSWPSLAEDGLAATANAAPRRSGCRVGTTGPLQHASDRQCPAELGDPRHQQRAAAGGPTPGLRIAGAESSRRRLSRQGSPGSATATRPQRASSPHRQAEAAGEAPHPSCQSWPWTRSRRLRPRRGPLRYSGPSPPSPAPGAPAGLLGC